MSISSKSTQLNFAPKAKRHPPLTWVILGASAIVCALCSYPLYYENELLAVVKSRQAQMLVTIKKDMKALRLQEAEQSKVDASNREKAIAQLQELGVMSWDGIFDSLERATDVVHSGVSILSLAPVKVGGDSAHLNVTALAANMPILLAYLEAMKKDPRVVQIELTSQQPDEKSGPSVIRFHANVLLNPKIVVSRPEPDVLPPVASIPVGKLDAIMPPDILAAMKGPVNPRDRR